VEDQTGNGMSRLSAAPPVLPPNEADSLAERWLKRIKSNPLIAALIVLGTMVTAVIGFWQAAGPVVTYFVTRPADTSLFEPITAGRVAAIEGSWSGTIQQEFYGHEVTYPGYLELEVHGKTLSGTLKTVLEDKVCPGGRCESTFDMTGGFIHDRFARLEYGSKNKDAVWFGTMILELSDDASELKGNFVAYGAHSHRIVTGPIKFRKPR
jgi:hypothetical protein